MKHIDETIAERPWKKLIDGSRLIKNPILGYVTPEEEQEALERGAVIKEYGTWKVPVVEIEATTKGSDYKAGDMIKIPSYKYLDWTKSRRNKEYAEFLNKESTNALLDDIPEF